jgi:hypothetical protein
MIEGGWICRACWKSNRPGDDRCYRCKTPREAQVEVAPGSLKEQTAPGYTMRGRMDTNLSLLAMLVAWPMWLSGWLGIIGGVLAGIGGALSLIGGDSENALLSVFGGALVIVLGAFVIFIARSVRRYARWAYVIAAVGYLLPSAPALLGIVEVPAGVVVPDWYLNVQTVLAIIYLVLGLGAVFLLITSFIRQGDEGTSASTEAG